MAIPSIRAADPGEAALLSDLALRSKGHWGYDTAFLEACRSDLTLTPGDITASATFVCEDETGILGFSRVVLLDERTAELDALFVDPAAMGKGVGRQLWERALRAARELGARDLVLQSDPHAEGFYRSRGARRIGEAASAVMPGRTLPLMHVTLRAP
ncbi:MAG: GNAT family N-acetyltransferase [Thermomicrobiales bacterium]|nr:GNAT family N-acetyltransferase [Thermomicrobiales bacterium]